MLAASRLSFWENMELCSTNIMRFMLQRFIFHYKLSVHLSYFSETIVWCHLKHLFLHRYLFLLLFKLIVTWTKINALIRRSMCCFNMAMNLKVLKMSPALFARHYFWKALPTRLIFSPMLLFAKTLRIVMTSWWGNDVRKFTADAILLREIQCKKIDNLLS